MSKNFFDGLFKSSLILDQPIRHIRTVKGDKISLFGLLADGIPFQRSFDEHLKVGLSLKKKQTTGIMCWSNLLSKENRYIFLGHQIYQEISKLRFWLRDVIIKRWAQECVERFGSTTPDLLSKFDLWKKPPDRDSALISKYRDLYVDIGLDNYLYCNSPLRTSTFPLDHFIPWSRFPVNSFWNLHPSCISCNSKKLDRIPKVDNELLLQVNNHLKICLAEADFKI